jgi:ABC-type Fe3+-hydroxamate transport system substrate-binding protein
MRHVVDARGASVMLPDRVRRVVSLVPSLTEWLVVAGVGERLVGVTDWCVEPADAVAGLARVRGTKNPDLEAVRRLEPDLVVANAEENRKLDVQRLEAGGLAVFVTMPTTVAGAVTELRDLATAVGELPGSAALDADLVAAVAGAYRRRPSGHVRYAWAIFPYPPIMAVSSGSRLSRPLTTVPCPSAGPVFACTPPLPGGHSPAFPRCRSRLSPIHRPQARRGRRDARRRPALPGQA